MQRGLDRLAPRPYLGLGLGSAGGWLRRDGPPAVDLLGSPSGVGLAYLIAGGARFEIHGGLSAVLGYHFFGTAALIDNVVGNSIDVSMHEFFVGLHHAL